ncbi:MAG TPA: hypothetical protein VNW97_11470 [Candidatus Saccharimonadales bacterium]|jgi:hypothetical protein|nr:hypothetical protein [Candidatus Saccharimonadales bacterium]
MDMHPEKSEIWRHAVIGVLVAVLVTGFHLATDFLAQHQNISWKMKVLFWLGFTLFFALAFATVSLFETYLWRRRLRAKIHLDEVETADGKWLDAVVQNGQVVGAGIITIESSQADGFSVSGDSYHVQDFEIQSQENLSSFRGRRGSVFGKDGIAYVYQGKLRHLKSGGETEQFGVAYYSFLTGDDNKDTNYFKGAYLARQEEAVLHVVGRSVPKGLPPDDVKNLLQAWVKGTKVRDFIAEISELQKKRAPAGPIG